MTQAGPCRLRVDALGIRFDTPEGPVHAVRELSLSLRAGECVGLVGESGSGKSQTCFAIAGLTAPNAAVSGRVLLDGEDLLAMDEPALRRRRGRQLAMIFQDPLTALTPHLRIGRQMREILSIHEGLRGKAAAKRCIDALDRVQLSQPDLRLRQYPHELSGGMRQRVLIAMAILCRPAVLLADEPTTALDVTVQAGILDLIDELRRELDLAMLLVTHDMGVVARLCDRVTVMRHGREVETNDVHSLFQHPRERYTQGLLAAVPHLNRSTSSPARQTAASTKAEALLSVEGLGMRFPVRDGVWRRRHLRALDDISFELRAGETLAVVGESGSGKSTLARCALDLLSPTVGRVSWLGRSLGDLDAGARRRARRHLQIVFQDPLASLDPSMPVGRSIAEPLHLHRPELSRKERREHVRAMLDRVGLDADHEHRYPHQLSGGQNQRVGVARALIAEPSVVICDEVVSALDVTVQARVLELLKALQRERAIAYLFIAHDLAVVRAIADRTLVLYRGRVVELAPTEVLFEQARHPYTRQLLAAVPIPDPAAARRDRRIRFRDDLPSPDGPDAAWRFRPSDRNRSPRSPPMLEALGGDHLVAMHDPLEALVADTPD